MYRARTSRVGGGRRSRGFRDRGRRGYYQGRAQHYPPPGPASLPPTSSSYATPVGSLSNPAPGALPTEGTTANVERQASTLTLKMPESNAQVLAFANHDETNSIVPLLAQQSSSGESVSTDNAHNPEQQQPHHEDQVEPSGSKEEQTKIDTSSSESGGIVAVGETSSNEKSRGRSSSPTDLYLYGPQSDFSERPESLLGKRKEPPPDPPGDGEEREGEDDQQEQSDAAKKQKVVSHDIVHSMTFVFTHVVSANRKKFFFTCQCLHLQVLVAF